MSLSCTAIIILLVFFVSYGVDVVASPAAAADSTSGDLSVKVYEGPTDCDENERVKSGDYVSMHYTGYIDESSVTGIGGDKFESSYDFDGGKPFGFHIGHGDTIDGWEEGLIGLCKGSKATLIVPPNLAYGEAGAEGVIPGDATLRFDIHILNVDSNKEQENLFELLDRDNNGVLDYDEIAVYFAALGQNMPDHFMDEEYKNDDGFIDWDEFAGPKGDRPPSGTSSAAPSTSSSLNDEL